MTPAQTIFLEAGKLVAQLGGAMLIAWLTVRWALGRFKSEKLWERRLAAFADAVDALMEMKRIADTWFEDHLANRERKAPVRQDLESRYTSAKRKVHEAHSLMLVIMPGPATETLAGFFKETEKIRGSSRDLFEELDATCGLLSTTLDRLLSQRTLVTEVTRSKTARAGT